jgi:Ca2+-binding RTX toxin-like protein
MPISVTQLTGQNGFKVAVAGNSVTIAGDFNNDGLADLVIGAPSADPTGRTDAGRTYVVYGQHSFGAVLQESDIAGATGFVIEGAAAGDSSGFAVSYAGDFNGDGYDDIVIGAPHDDLGANTDAGSVHLVFGTAAGFASPLQLGALNGTNGFTLTGEYINSRAGYSLDAAGDFNLDGFDDFLVSAPVYWGGHLDEQRSGSYVIYGGQTLGASSPLASVGTGVSGIRMIGSTQNQLGRDVSGLGDVNGDGRPDILFTRYSEASFQISGQPTSGLLVHGPAGSGAAASYEWGIVRDGPTVDTSAAGDFNGDGIGDYIVTLHGEEADRYAITGTIEENKPAAAVVVFGRTDGQHSNTLGLNSTTGFAALSAYSAASVDTAGDFNGDGIDDIVIGAGTSAYILFGSRSLPFRFDIDNLAPNQGLVVTDVGGGAKVAGAGDVNGDGYDDVAITSSLGSWVVFGGINNPPMGTPGDDSMIGTPSQDTLIGEGGNDYLSGLASDDILRGGDGDDVLNGGAGNDRMEGGAGSDTFYVDSALDVVVDPVAAGVDRVAAAVSYALAADADIEILEAITLSATTPFAFTGNNYGQTIIGNAGVNYLDARGGDDVLLGLGGDDVLNGGAGNDTMHGGTGNDNYYVGEAGDSVVEAAGEGRDRIATSISYALAAGVEVELIEAITSTASDNLDIAGNAFNQTIVGNAGANLLDGGAGSDVLAGLAGADTLRGGDGNDVLEGGQGIDRMEGGAGSDTYYVDSANDVVIDPLAEGVDRVAAAMSYTLAAGADIEILEAITLGDTTLLDFVGNEFGTTLIGNSGANFLDGKGGMDVLVGGHGADTLAFTSALGAGNVDWVEGFQSGIDKIALSNTLFGAIAPGALAAGAFATGSAAHDGDDRIVYDSATGALYYDSDGTGAAAQVQFATLNPGTALNASDFILI